MAADQPPSTSEQLKAAGVSKAKKELGSQAARAGAKKLGKTAVGQATKKAASQASIKAAGLASGAVSGGVGTAVTIGSMIAGQAKNIGKTIGALFLAMVSTGMSAAIGGTATASIIAIILIPVVTAFILVVANTGAYIVPPSVEVFQYIDESPSEYTADCPLIDGRLLGNTWGSYRSSTETGHGSNLYWDLTGYTPCSFAMPQKTSCRGALDPGNYTYSCSTPANRCPYFGFSADFVSSTSPAVYLPTINGEKLSWNHTGKFANRNSGYSHIYTDTTSRYTIVFTHIQQEADESNGIPSGTRIGILFGGLPTPHLHTEFSANGVWQRPEDVFCN